MKVLLLTPPMTQLNTPYPATAYLTGFLRAHNVSAVQADPALELVLRLFSRSGLERVRATGGDSPAHFVSQFEKYYVTVEPTLRFLQGKDPSLALRIVSRRFLPEGPRFGALDAFTDLQWAFGSLGVQDQAKYLATLYLEDLVDVVRKIDPRFELSRYGEQLASSQASFAPLQQALAQPLTLVDEILLQIGAEFVEQHQPTLVALTTPFPGNVYGALRLAQWLKKNHPAVKVAWGGGYVTTELRELAEPRVFDFVDYVIIDDGERPLLSLIEHLRGTRPQENLQRTFLRTDGKVKFINHKEADLPPDDSGDPTYDGLALGDYLSLVDVLNPMHRIWSDGRWNKLTLAHGCYWKKCNFCDLSLDYISRYEATKVDTIVRRIEKLIAETGQRGFHFVDEAAPPALLKALAQKLLERKIAITWWGNIRFEKAFSPGLTDLLARSGCVAVSGGLEVASDRLLKLMNKGVTVEQVARVARAFTQSGVMVHAYLMYGFPSQTEQETMDALERVRQLFATDCIQSAYWHRFSATVHSPVGQHPEKFGIHLGTQKEGAFGRLDLTFSDPRGDDPARFTAGLNKALYNFMHGVGLDFDVRKWFDQPMTKAKVPKNLISNFIKN